MNESNEDDQINIIDLKFLKKKIFQVFYFINKI